MTRYNSLNQYELRDALNYLASSKKPFVIFGAGADTLNLMQKYLLLFKIRPTAILEILDGRIGSQFLGYPVIGISELKNYYKDTDILVPSTLLSERLFDHLSQADLLKYVIVIKNRTSAEILQASNYFSSHAPLVQKAYTLLSDEKSKNIFLNRINFLITREIQYLEQFYEEDQYFPQELIHLTDDEIFIDGGAFDGDTALEFAKKTNYTYQKLILLEPDKEIFQSLLTRTASLPNVECHQIGTWNTQDMLSFNSGNKGGGSISSNGDTIIAVNSIDNILNGSPCTYIKLDVEGAESKSLLGAIKTIRTYKPKLAVCVYHHIEDIFLILFKSMRFYQTIISICGIIPLQNMKQFVTLSAI